MITINKNTKRGQALINHYNRATATTIHEAYKNPSGHKVAAFTRIKLWMEREKGRDMRITGKSCHSFSCAFKNKSGNLVYVTRDNDYIVK